MKHRASSTRRMNAPDIHNGQTNKQTDVFHWLFVCVLDGVRHWFIDRHK